MEPFASPAAPPRIAVRSYPRALRGPLAAMVALGWGALLALAVGVGVLPMASGEGLPRLAAGTLAAVLLAPLPLAAAALARRAARGTLRVEAGALVVEAGDRRAEVPVTALGGARPWRLPLPSDGVAVALASGRPFPLALEAEDPAAALDLLAATGAAGVARPPARLAWARARERLRPRAVELALRWGLLPAAIAAILFRAHQHVAFGDTLGEWRMLGPASWAATLAGYAAATAGLLVLLGAGVRVLAEAVAALWTALAPAQAVPARRAAEWLCRAVLYAGVPALVALRFLA
jgi:hypothetical protein